MKVKKTIYLLLCLMLFSCPAESVMWERAYQITNNSGHDITIRAFKNYTGTGTFEDRALLENEVFTGAKASGTNFDYANDLNNDIPTTSYSFTRLIVVYNNERRMNHSIVPDDDNDVVFSNPINRNLLRGGNYTHIGNDIYEYVLTEEDYNNATPCGGDCLD